MLDACLTSRESGTRLAEWTISDDGIASPNDVKFLMDRDQVAKCAQQCNMKKRELWYPFVRRRSSLQPEESAKLAEEQSIHLYLCILIHDLTERYGPVVRQGRVTGVLDEAFDVVVASDPPLALGRACLLCIARVWYREACTCGQDASRHCSVRRAQGYPLVRRHFLAQLSADLPRLYWTTQDVLSFVASTTDDPNLLKIKALGERYALGTSTAQTRDADALLQDDDALVSSAQYTKSAQRHAVGYEGLRSSGGHRIQDVRELMSIPVIITSDMSKSPPVLVVYACELVPADFELES